MRRFFLRKGKRRSCLNRMRLVAYSHHVKWKNQMIQEKVNWTLKIKGFSDIYHYENWVFKMMTLKFVISSASHYYIKQIGSCHYLRSLVHCRFILPISPLGNGQNGRVSPSSAFFVFFSFLNDLLSYRRASPSSAFLQSLRCISLLVFCACFSIVPYFARCYSL